MPMVNGVRYSTSQYYIVQPMFTDNINAAAFSFTQLAGLLKRISDGEMYARKVDDDSGKWYGGLKFISNIEFETTITSYGKPAIKVYFDAGKPI